MDVNKAFGWIVKKYGEEKVLGMMLEELNVLVEERDKDLIKAIKDAVRDCSCDTGFTFELGSEAERELERIHTEDRCKGRAYFTREAVQKKSVALPTFELEDLGIIKNNKRLIYLKKNGRIFVDFI